MTDEVPRTFRRDSRLFLSVALLLILFLNFVTLLFFRNATEWGSRQTERRASEILNRMALPYADPAEALRARGRRSPPRSRRMAPPGSR